MTDRDFWKGIIKESTVLNPVDRIAEVLFGLIMVLSFTGAISLATAGREEVRELLWAALGCNVAWGLVDAIMYLMNVVIERGHSLKILHTIARSGDSEASRQIMREEMQPLISTLLKDEEVDQLCERLKRQSLPSVGHLIGMADFIAGAQIFLLVFLCTLPVALPFVFFNEVPLALRSSNVVAVGLLFIGGYLLAGYAGFSRFRTAVIYVIIGVLLVSLTMALGG